MRSVGGNAVKKDHHLAEINRSGADLITGGGTQAWAIVTQRGIILVDVPEPLPSHRPLRVTLTIAGITGKPINLQPRA